MLSHGNLLVTMNSLMYRVKDVKKDETYIAYLPLAHVLELLGFHLFHIKNNIFSLILLYLYS